MRSGKISKALRMCKTVLHGTMSLYTWEESQKKWAIESNSKLFYMDFHILNLTLDLGISQAIKEHFTPQCSHDSSTF